MKKFVGLMFVIFSIMLCAEAMAGPLKPKDAPKEYFAISFLTSTASANDATIAVNYSVEGLAWNKPTKILLAGKPAKAVRGVDMTNHNYGILQGFAHDFKSMQLDRLFGKKLPNGLQMGPPASPLPVAKTGPPATIILPSGDQILACNVDGRIKVFKGKVNGSSGFLEMKWQCEDHITGRPDVAFMRGYVLIAWRAGTKGIMTALYKSDAAGRLKFIRCENPFYTGPVEIYSEPVLAASDEIFYMGLVVKKQGEPTPQFKIYGGALGTNWKDHANLGKAASSHIKLGLAAKHGGELFAAMVGKGASGLEFNAWLYSELPKQGWTWSNLAGAPWGKVAPALKEFGLDRGGVRR
jgi:hypothetical protein